MGTTIKTNLNTNAAQGAATVTKHIDGADLTDNDTGALYIKDIVDNKGTTDYKRVDDTVIKLSNIKAPTQAFIKKLLRDIGSLPRTIDVNTPVTFSENTIFTSNINLEFQNNVQFNVPTGITVYINGTIKAGNYQIFTGAGTVIIGEKAANLAWFGGLPDSGVDVSAALKAAQRSLLMGGVLTLPDGNYKCSGGITEFPNDFKIISPRSATIDGIANFDMSKAIRLGGDYPRNNADVIFTFLNTTQKGDQFIELKEASMLSNFAVGDVIHICNGANYYDQDLAEQNQIVRISGSRLYLKYNLAREYSTAFTQYFGVTNADFIQPAVGANVTITGTDLPAPTGSAVGSAFSFGDNVYLIQAGSTSTSVIAKNPGRGNSPAGTVIPSGTKVSKARIIIKSTRTRNFQMENIKIYSSSTDTIRLLRLDNSYGSSFKNCIFEINPAISATANASLWFTDDACDNRFENCSFISPFLFSTQISRSAVRSKYLHCTFTNALIDISEFSYDCEFLFNRFEYNKVADILAITKFINIGNSTSKIVFKGNTIHATNENSNSPVTIFGSGEIQAQTIGDTDAIVIEDNFIFCRNISSVTYGNNKGITIFNNNRIFGSIDYFGSIGTAQSSLQAYGFKSEYKFNRFVGTISKSATNPFISIAGPCEVEDNYFENSNLNFTVTDYLKTTLQFANDLIDGTYTFKNNIFYRFPLLNAWFVPGNNVIDNRFDISNNKFRKCIVGNNRVAPTFNFSLRDSQTGLISDAKNYLSTRTSKLDLQLYRELVTELGGALSDANVAAAKFVFDALYANNLISKAVYLNIFQGDALASLVPLVGWGLGGNRPDIRTYKSALQANGILLTDYDPVYGWSGDASGKALSLLNVSDIDLTDVSLFVQTSKADTINTQPTAVYLIGGSANASFRIGYATNITGIAGVNIRATYVPSPGFIFTSRNSNTGTQFHYLDTVAQPAYVSPTTTGGTNLSNITGTTTKLSTHSSNLANPTNVGGNNTGIISAGVFTSLTQAEVLILDDIIQQAMVMLGRPTQAASGRTVKTVTDTYYSKSESDARYAITGASYTKSESDANNKEKVLTSVTANKTILMTDFGNSTTLTIWADATTAAFTITLPPAASLLGYTINIFKTDNSANAITIKANGSEFINAANTDAIATTYETRTYKSNGTKLGRF